MANRPAPALALRDGDREVLEETARSASLRAGAARRARIVLMAADGVANSRAADLAGCSVNTVKAWRARYLAEGLVGLEDRARPGRPRGAFKFSTDPELEAKVVDVVGLYLDPPEDAIVLSIDDEPQIQALDRTAPQLATGPGETERGSPGHTRHDTTALFAALETATGKLASRVKPRHRAAGFLAFLKQVARAHPEGELHLVLDNCSTHQQEDVQAWLAANPRVRVHFAPSHASWLNQVEIFFGIVQRQAPKRGASKSVQQLNQTFRRFVDHYNKDCQPFKWIKTAPQILRQTNHQQLT